MRWIALILILVCAPVWGFQPKAPVGSRLVRANPITKGLVGYWPMNEGAGDKVFDVSGHGLDGTCSGTTWGVSPNGSVLEFDGSDTVTIPNPGWTLPDVTIVVWVRIDSDTGDYRFFRSTLDDYELQFYRRAVLGRLQVTWGDGTNWAYEYITNFTASGNWQCVAVTKQGTAWRFYNNGVHIGSATGDSHDAVLAASIVLGISLNGAMGQVGVWSRALSASDIASLFADPYQMVQSPAPPTAYYASGGAPPATTPRVIMIMSSVVPYAGAPIVIASLIVFLIGARRHD